MSREDFIKNYWSYYISLEKKFLQTEEYVSIEEDNFNTYSIEYASQILTIGAEIDAVMKEICGFSQTERKNMSDYIDIVLTKFSDIKQREIKCKDTIIIKPYENWEQSNPATSLVWWENYNSIKHGRVSNYKNANLNSVLYSLAGLFALEMYMIKDLQGIEGSPDVPTIPSRIFKIENWSNIEVLSDNVYVETVHEWQVET